MIREVKSGQSIQSAIDAAQPGDTISVEAGATFRGPIELPAKSSDAEILIQSSRVSELPQSRVSPTHSALMPKITAPHADQAIRTKPGAHHYKFDGIEVLPDLAATEIYDLARFGGSRHEQTTLASVPHHLKMDRCYVHGNSKLSLQRGLSLNSADTEVTRCYISEITGSGMDAQAIASWNTPGRNKIIDCYLEATGENLMLGGADPASLEQIPSDYSILNCHLFKPLTWKGQGWTIKNLLELKAGQRIRIEGCTLENNWEGEGQDGHSVLFTVRNQEGSAPYSLIRDVDFTNNVLKNCERGINLLGTDNEKPSGKTSAIRIINNLFHLKWTFLTINGTDDVIMDHNTVVLGGNIMTAYGTVSQTFRLLRSIFTDAPNGYGIVGDGVGEGNVAIAGFLPGSEILENVFTAKPVTTYPAGNYFPANDTEIGFAANFSLTTASQFKSKGTDGKDIGADFSKLGTVSPVEPVPTPTPIPPPAPLPDPTPTPEPTPTPSPVPVETRKVFWPKQEGRQRAVLDAQWTERFRLKDTALPGEFAVFEKVP